MSYAAALGSAGCFIGTPAMSYKEGFVWLIIGAAQTGSVFSGLGILGKRMAIIGRKIGAVTLPKLLESRFPSITMKYLVPIITIVFLTIYMVPQNIGGARVMEAVTGIPYVVGVLVVGLTTALYTALGGYMATSINSIMQGILMSVGSFGLFAVLIQKAGGFAPIIVKLYEINPALISPNLGGTLSYPYMFSYGWLMLGFALMSMPHAAVRNFSYKDTKSLHKAMIIGTIVTFAFTAVIWFVGSAGKVVLGSDLAVPDMVIPMSMDALLPPSLAGIFLAVPFAAIMSTVSSMQLIVSSSLVEDLYVTYKKGKVSNATIKKLNMWSSAIIGIVVVVLAMYPPDLLQKLIFFSIGGIASCLLIPLVLGLYWPRANVQGAVASTIGGGIAFVLFTYFVPRISSFQPITWSIAVSLLLMIVVSNATPKPDKAILQVFWGK